MQLGFHMNIRRHEEDYRMCSQLSGSKRYDVRQAAVDVVIFVFIVRSYKLYQNTYDLCIWAFIVTLLTNTVSIFHWGERPERTVLPLGPLMISIFFYLTLITSKILMTSTSQTVCHRGK